MSGDALDTWPHPGVGVPAYGVIGWPIAHSLSPQIHQAAFQACGLPGSYDRLPVEPEQMPLAVQRLRRDGFAGANVTMPHKEAAATLATTRTDDVERLKAANTVSIDGDQVHAANTDVPGFVDFLVEDLGWDATGRRALIFGAGGAARACALALSRMQIGELIVSVRDPARASVLTECVGSARVIDLTGAPKVRADLIINATPAGGDGRSLPHPKLSADMVVVDLLYAPRTTPLLEAAAGAGAQAHDGLGLLVRQAAHSFQIWTRCSAPVEAMWEAAKQARSATLSGDSGAR